jgi:hypothetical protein
MNVQGFSHFGSHIGVNGARLDRLELMLPEEK